MRASLLHLFFYISRPFLATDVFRGSTVQCLAALSRPYSASAVEGEEVTPPPPLHPPGCL